MPRLDDEGAHLEDGSDFLFGDFPVSQVIGLLILAALVLLQLLVIGAR